MDLIFHRAFAASATLNILGSKEVEDVANVWTVFTSGDEEEVI